tara:strand:- start:1207 stop:2340 length:1134 start_codon:yes stop_codon:yes gene_type:complete
MNIRLFYPLIEEDDLESLRTCFNDSWLGLGSKVYEFENEWIKKIVPDNYAVACNSATAALHIALLALNLPPDSEVIVPSLTFVSSVNAIVYAGLKPVFAEVDPKSLTISIDSIRNLINKNTSAILPVHYGGEPCNMEDIINLATSNNLKVIEDCAHTQGGIYKNKVLGTWGDIGCFSFEEKKGMTTGDGGMLVTKNKDVAELAKRIRWLGINKDTWTRAKNTTSQNWYYEISELGFKYNMNNIAASLGLSQLKKLDRINSNKTNLIKKYLHTVNDLSYAQPLLPYSLIENNTSSYWLFGLRCDNRDSLMDYLDSKSVSVGMHFTPINEQPLYSDSANKTPITSEISKKLITLPLSPAHSSEEIDYVCDLLKSYELNY